MDLIQPRTQRGDIQMVADSHIHLTHNSFENLFPYLDYNGADFVSKRDGTRTTLIEEMKSRGVAFCIEPAITLDSNASLLALAETCPGFLYPAVGIHPTRTYRYPAINSSGQKTTKILKKKAFYLLKQYAQHPAVVAIGETGLDYHLERKKQHRLRQKAWFIRQLLLAHEKQLPVILHIRDADQDALRILRLLHSKLHGGVCHCFCGNAEIARAYTSLGLMLGIGGLLLQKPEDCADLEDAVRKTPIEFLLLETDSPYVKPVCTSLSRKQHNKVRNTSLILPAVAARIAELKGMTPEAVECITLENIIRTFHLS